MKFPNIIANSNEEYITLPALKTFVKSKAITVSKEAETSRNKAAYIAAISEYADKAPDNHKEVIEWIDAVIKEGIKDVQISHVTLSSEGEILFANEARAQKRFEDIIVSKMSAPSTYPSMAREFYLKDNICFIWFNLQELETLVKKRGNLLEAIDVKILELKTNSTKKFVDIGLSDI